MGVFVRNILAWSNRHDKKSSKIIIDKCIFFSSWVWRFCCWEISCSFDSEPMCAGDPPFFVSSLMSDVHCTTGERR
jgi:hypothetical protein